LVLRSSSGEWILTPPVTVPKDASAVEIDGEGTVRIWDSPHHSLEKIGTIQIGSFDASSVLIEGDGTIFYKPADITVKMQAPNSDGRGVIRQGCLEESNVDVKRELDELAHIAAQIQSMEQATRLLQPAALDPGHGR
jgi:flagellar basal-body rod protein FlgG